jgi:pimeloyl-ACP methyl ester carboxylesterase
VFFVASPIRMFPELAAALTLRDWPRLVVTLGANVVRASLSSARMAQRVACMTRFRFSDAATVHAPALVITGEDRLDRVVKPELTRQYLQHLPQAKCVTLASTGHLGLITRPTEFAAIVYRFANDAAANDNSISA